MPEFKIDPDYKEVAERLRDLFAKHPEASLRGTYEFVPGYVVYRAECYRTPDDQAPGVGSALEELPGRTPYTKGSELQNAETSAWGRAIVAVGASESKRIASADEMRLARDRREAPPEPVAPQRPPPADKERIDKLVDRVADAQLADWVREQGFEWPWSPEACDQIEAKVSQPELAI
jgi:hypothetical protein